MTTEQAVATAAAPSLVATEQAITSPTPETMTPHQTFLETLPDAYKVDPAFKNFNSLEDMARSYKSAASMVGLDKNDVLRIPKESTPEAMGEIWNKLGRPEAVDGYEYTAYKDIIPQDEFSEYAKIAHDNGISNQGFKALVDSVLSKANGAQAGQSEASIKQVEEWQSQIKQEYGAAHAEKIGLAQKAVLTLGGKELVNEISKNPAMFENPAVIKAFVNMGEQLQKIAIQTKEDNGFLNGASTASGAMSPSEAKAAIAELEQSADWKRVAMDASAPGRAAIMEKKSRLYAYAYPEERKR